MNTKEIKKLAVKKLNTKKVKHIKQQLCSQFIDKKEKKDCNTEFDKSFIKSFINSYQNNN